MIDESELINGRVENDPVVIAAKCAPTAFDLSKDMQQYRAIGTVDECRVAVEKQTAKKISSAWCPSCKKYLTTQHLKGKYHCVYCGQKLDWSDEEYE